MSLAVYVLTGIRRDAAARRTRRRSSTSCSARSRAAFLLYGIAFIYGADRQHALDRIGRSSAAHRRARRRRCCSLASALLLVGFAFKVAAVPFHMWTPDAYEGAPTPVTGVHVDGRQGGGVRRVRARVPARRSTPLHARLERACSGSLAALTMTVGNVVGVRADERQAHAGVLEHRARRLPAGRARRRRTTPAAAPCSSTCSPTRS